MTTPFADNTLDLTARQKNRDEIRDRLGKALDDQRSSNIHGLSYHEARDALADYLTGDGLAELMVITQRDVERQMGMPVEPLAEAPEEWYSVYNRIKDDPETSGTGTIRHSSPKPL